MNILSRRLAPRPSAIKREGPWVFSSLQELFENALDNCMSSPVSSHGERLPVMDVSEDDKQFQVRMELPGVDSGDVEIAADNGCILVQGEKKTSTEDKGVNYIRREASYGSFQRSVALPEIANLEAAKATFKDGVLTVSVPKKEIEHKRSKKIEIEAV